MWQRVLRPRVLAYTGVLALIVIGFMASLVLRTPFKADVVRDRGVLARLVDDGRIENVYRIQLMNATERTQQFRIEVDGLPGAVLVPSGATEVGATQARWVPLTVQITPQLAQSLGGGAHPMHFRIALQESGQTVAVVSEKSTFVVPR